METGELVLLRREPESSVAEIVLNRPEKRNAMSVAAQEELIQRLEECREGVKVILVTGAGDRSFCAGVDLTEVSGKPQNAMAGADRWLEAIEMVRHHPAVVIAAVNGFALGGGLTLVNVADLALAADHATFAVPELKYGVFPRLSGPSAMRRLSRKNAAWMCLTAQPVDAATALSWGMINGVFRREQLMAEARRLAQHIAAFEPVALGWTKRALDEMEPMDWQHSLEFGLYVKAMVATQRGSGPQLGAFGGESR